jgi:hypothetical protein
VAFCSSASLPSSLSVSLLHSISPSFITAYEPTTSLSPARLMCCMTRTPRPLSRLRPSGMAALFSSPPHSLNIARLSRSTDLQYVRERVQCLKLRLRALDRRFRSCLRAISSLRSQITPNPPLNPQLTGKHQTLSMWPRLDMITGTVQGRISYRR